MPSPALIATLNTAMAVPMPNCFPSVTVSALAAGRDMAPRNPKEVFSARSWGKVRVRGISGTSTK